MDQTVSGAAGIESGEAFGVIPAAIIQTLIEGVSGIPSGVAFGVREGVYIPIQTVPVASYHAS